MYGVYEGLLVAFGEKRIDEQMTSNKIAIKALTALSKAHRLIPLGFFSLHQ